jgi:hypothetical protein
MDISGKIDPGRVSVLRSIKEVARELDILMNRYNTRQIENMRVNFGTPKFTTSSTKVSIKFDML